MNFPSDDGENNRRAFIQRARLSFSRAIPFAHSAFPHLNSLRNIFGFHIKFLARRVRKFMENFPRHKKEKRFI